jgi:hypothetical protein
MGCERTFMPAEARSAGKSVWHHNGGEHDRIMCEPYRTPYYESFASKIPSEKKPVALVRAEWNLVARGD